MAKNIFVEVKESVDNWNSLLRAIDFIKNHDVYVGIEDDVDRENKDGTVNTDVTNAELLYIHTNGSQKRNIPARPVIEPAIKKDSERLHRMMANAANYAFKGDTGKAIEELKKVGMRGQNVSRAYFYDEDNGWPPDKPETIRRKMKGKPKGYEPRTLIDTSQLKNAITYFVKTKGGRTK